MNYDLNNILFYYFGDPSVKSITLRSDDNSYDVDFFVLCSV
jgi:hypothetical protein